MLLWKQVMNCTFYISIEKKQKVKISVVLLAHNMSEAAIKGVMGEFSTECISLRQALWKNTEYDS